MALPKEKWTLVLETSVTRATLVLAKNDAVIANTSFVSERSQECDLFAPLQAVLAQMPDGQALSAIVVGTGPGSYNGARVGIATAQAIAQVHQCQIAGLCSFEGVAETTAHETLWAVGDARRGSYFLMPIRKGRAQTPPQLLEEAEFLAALADSPGPKITFESPERLPPGAEALESQSSAEGLLRSWSSRSEEEQTRLFDIPPEAFYLRPPHITKAKKKPIGP